MHVSDKGIAITGYAADGRQIVNRAREEADNYKVYLRDISTHTSIFNPPIVL